MLVTPGAPRVPLLNMRSGTDVCSLVSGDRWKCVVTPEERRDHEVPGAEAGTSLEALLPHRQTEANQVLNQQDV